jgi:hypothetical protein
MNTPPAEADGFSDKLCGNPLAWRPRAGSRPKRKIVDVLRAGKALSGGLSFRFNRIVSQERVAGRQAFGAFAFCTTG